MWKTAAYRLFLLAGDVPESERVTQKRQAFGEEESGDLRVKALHDCIREVLNSCLLAFSMELSILR